MGSTLGSLLQLPCAQGFPGASSGEAAGRRDTESEPTQAGRAPGRGADPGANFRWELGAGAQPGVQPSLCMDSMARPLAPKHKMSRA